MRRNDFMYRLEEAGVTTRQGTHAVHTLGYYKKTYGLQDAQYLASYAADRLSVALPLYYGMTDEEFDYVIGQIGAAPECPILKKHLDKRVALRHNALNT